MTQEIPLWPNDFKPWGGVPIEAERINQWLQETRGKIALGQKWGFVRSGDSLLYWCIDECGTITYWLTKNYWQCRIYPDGTAEEGE